MAGQFQLFPNGEGCPRTKLAADEAVPPPQFPDLVRPWYNSWQTSVLHPQNLERRIPMPRSDREFVDFKAIKQSVSMLQILEHYGLMPKCAAAETASPVPVPFTKDKTKLRSASASKRIAGIVSAIVTAAATSSTSFQEWRTSMCSKPPCSSQVGSNSVSRSRDAKVTRGPREAGASKGEDHWFKEK
jgi:hypothetical protein